MRKVIKENAPSVKDVIKGTPAEQINGVRSGKIVVVDEGGRVFIDYAGNPHGHIAARFTSSVKLQSLREAQASGQEVLLAFENSDTMRPIIIDTISSLVDEVIREDALTLNLNELKDITIDGRKITFDAKEQIVLKCGKASITLTRAGKVFIRGEYVLSRSSGVNKIKGGSVQIN